MGSDEKKKLERREFLKQTGIASIGAVAATLGAGTAAEAAEPRQKAIRLYWKKKQKQYEELEKKHMSKWKAFDAPPRYIYRNTDPIDSTPSFYAPLMEECKYLPEFQSIFTEGTAGQYFKYTLGFGMKDIVRFHGHSCEALYYTAAICRLMIDEMFPEGYADRTLLRGIGGKSP